MKYSNSLVETKKGISRQSLASEVVKEGRQIDFTKKVDKNAF